MIKASWGTKQTCPKCGARFYDLGKANPVICIECENSWVPEPILKSKQPMAVAKTKPVETVKAKKEPAIIEGEEEVVKGDESEEDILAKEGLDIEIEDDGDDATVASLSLDDDNPDVAEVIDTSAIKANEDI